MSPSVFDPDHSFPIEVENLYQLYDEVRRGGPLPDVPLVILCSVGNDDL